MNERGYDKKTKKCLVGVDKRYFRPNELNYLKGSSKKAKNDLGWECEISFKDLVREMIDEELNKT